MPLGLAASIFPGIRPASPTFALGPRLAPLLPLLLLFSLLQYLWAAPCGQRLVVKGAGCRYLGQAGRHCLTSLRLQAAPAVHALSAPDNIGNLVMHGLHVVICSTCDCITTLQPQVCTQAVTDSQLQDCRLDLCRFQMLQGQGPI